MIIHFILITYFLFLDELLFEMFDVCGTFFRVLALILFWLLNNDLFRPPSFTDNSRDSWIDLFLWNLFFKRFSMNLRYLLFRAIFPLRLAWHVSRFLCADSSIASIWGFLFVFYAFLFWRNRFLFVNLLLFTLIPCHSSLGNEFWFLFFIILFLFAMLIDFMFFWITP